MPVQIKASERKNLFFESCDLGSPRTNEFFDEVAVSEAKSDQIRLVVDQSLQLLDLRYWPVQLSIDLETSATMQFPDGFQEQIPISLIVSQQQPKDCSIRMGVWDIENDSIAFQSILAHEMGHMLPEFACRQTGVVPPSDPFLTHWSKPIYEGVADWTAAVIMNSSLIGSNSCWFSRDILKWETLAESQDTVGDMAELLRSSITKLQLDNYRAYSEWIELVGKYLGDQPDPYAEGQWIAKQLWLKSSGRRRSRKVFDAIINVALTGDEFKSAEGFLAEVDRKMSI